MGSARLLRYVLRRLLQAIPVVLGVVILNFLLLQLAPGDAATVLAGEAGGAPAEYVQALRTALRSRQAGAVQLALYVKNILALDLGYSFRNQSAVLPLILARLSATLLLMGTTLVLSIGGSAFCSGFSPPFGCGPGRTTSSRWPPSSPMPCRSSGSG